MLVCIIEYWVDRGLELHSLFQSEFYTDDSEHRIELFVLFIRKLVFKCLSSFINSLGKQQLHFIV